MLKNLFNRMRPTPAPAQPAPVPAPIDTAATGRADALVAEGNAREDAGDAAAAEALYREAIAAAPGHPRGHLNLGIALAARGDLDGAAASYDRVLAIDPAHPFGNYNFARLALMRGDAPRAAALVGAALAARPEFPQALMLQSRLLEAQGRRSEAIVAIEAALKLQPDDPGNWFNLGSMLRAQGRADEAEAALRRALAADPDNVEMLAMLAAVLRDQGFADEALAALQASASGRTLSWHERSTELLLSLYAEGLAPEELLRRHVRFGVDLEQAHPVRFTHARAPREPGRRLRVGYLSGDFLLHPVCFFLLPVLEHHDRAQVEVFCYSFTRGTDNMNKRLREFAEHWRDVQALSVDAIADAVHADGIDLLIDLGGHSGEPRLGVFAQRPAPVQAAWLGYLNTTGLSRMDHRLTDHRADPVDIAQPQHVERLQYLPHSQWCYEALVHEPITPGAPFERRGHLTFGSFNAAVKISAATCRRWGELLARVPGSRLVVANCKSMRKREAVLRGIAAAGVTADRVTFSDRVPLDKYLALYNSVDIALDSFPYGGGTTTLDAIWMGTPVAAAVGPTSVSRSAASILQALGLDDWVAPSVDRWVDMVVDRAADRDALRTLRRELRPRLLASPLSDVKGFVRDLEATYLRLCAAAPAPVADDVARADALVAQGNEREDAGDLDAAEALYRQAIAAAPGHARGHLNLGIVRVARGDAAGATQAYERVLAIDARHAFGLYNYARLVFMQGDHARALALVEAAIVAKPDFAQALAVKSSVLDAMDRLDDAIPALQASLALQPDDAGNWFNLALLLRRVDRRDEAEAAVAQVLARDPDNLAALEVSMRIQMELGFADRALPPVQRFVQLSPTTWPHRSFELMLMNFAGGFPADETFERHLALARDLERAFPVRLHRWPERGDPQRRLRIGYLSCDLVLHAVPMFLAPVLEHHDAQRVETFCYDFGTHKKDKMTARLRQAADHWRDVAALSDEAIADAIHADGIDVLVDLAGHSGLPRPGIICQRPAPVQVSWLGYLNTTGLSTMDFRLCDVRTDPPGIAQPLHTERLFPLPDSQWCFQPISQRPPVLESPFVRNGHITFGSLNNALKITPALARAWGRLLARTPGSRLLVADTKSARKQEAILADIASQGVAPGRVEFLLRMSLDDYADFVNGIDIALDTFPYGGGTTTFDALWRGVPVVSAVGDLPTSRSASSLLAYLGLDDWIAPGIAQYVDVAVARASDLDALQALRRDLPARIQGSPLADMPRFVANLEAAYRTMWLEKTS